MAQQGKGDTMQTYSRKRRVLKQFFLLVFLGSIFFFVKETPVLASNPIIAGDFASLKAAIEAPERDTVLVVPGGRYVFTDTVIVSKDLTLQNQAGEKVEFVLGIFNTSRGTSSGKTMLDVREGTLILAADSNDHLYFDGTSEWNRNRHDSRRNGKLDNQTGNVDDVSNKTLVDKKGVFVTLHPHTKGIIEHATFANAANGGALSGAVFADYKSTLVMNDGLFTHNFTLLQETAANGAIYHRGLDGRGLGSKTRSASVTVFGATFEMNGGKITDNYSLYSMGSAIAATGSYLSATSEERGDIQRAKITLNGGEILRNSSHTFADPDRVDVGGGAVFLDVNTDFTVRAGEFSDNYAHGSGGFLFANWGTRVTIEGGNFARNEAQRMGGAIALYDGFMSYDPTTDSIVASSNPYGITDVNTWYDRGLGVELRVNGGTFTENKAYIGGAMYIATDRGEINAGRFTKNEADRFGGAIYLASIPYRLTIRNAYITNNTSDHSYGTMGYNHYAEEYTPRDSDNVRRRIKLFPDLSQETYHTSSGGGIWYCPTGSGTLHISNGVAVFDNHASVEGDDFTSMQKEGNAEYKVSVSNRALGGGWVDWYADTMEHRYSEGDTALDPLVDRSDNIMLKASLRDRAKRAARSLATTFFEENIAKRGGAIATNGHVDFGDGQQEFEVTVHKTWSDKVTKKIPVTIELLVVTKEGDFVVESTELNEINHFSHTFESLPLQSNGNMTYKIHEVGTEYLATYSYRLNEGELQATDTFSTEDLVHGDQIRMEIHNEMKPVKPDENSPFRPVLPLPSKPIVPGSPIKDKVPKTSSSEASSEAWFFLLLSTAGMMTVLHQSRKIKISRKKQ